MHRYEKSWTTDWSSFIKSVGNAFDEGLDNNAVTERFSGQVVSWVGKVSNKRLDDEEPGIELEMPTARTELSDGRHSTVDYLFLRLALEDIESWGDVEPGTNVRFKTSVTRSNGPFPGLQWSELDERRGVILIATENGTLVEAGIAS